MKIKSITGINLKGGDFAHTLGAFTLITGPNGSGKTRIVDAIRLAAIGYHPTLGKTNAATMELASGSNMTVSAELDNGTTLTRSWERKGRGITQTQDIPGTIKIDLNVFDWNVFMGAKPTDRALMIRQRSGSDKDPRETIKEAVRAIPNLPPISWPKTEDIAEWLEEAQTTIDTAKKEHAATAKRMEQTIQGLAALQLSDAPTEDISLADVEAAESASLLEHNAWSGILRKITEIKAALAEAEHQYDPQMAIQQPIDVSQTEGFIEQAQKKIGALEQEIATLDETAKQRNRIRTRLAEIQEKKMEATIELAIRVDLKEMKKALADLHPSTVAAHQAELCGHEQKMRTVQTSLDRINAMISATHIPQPEERCPHCGAEAKHGDQTIIAGEKEKLAKLKESKVEAEADMAKVKAAHDEAAQQLEDAKKIDAERERLKAAIKCREDYDAMLLEETELNKMTLEGVPSGKEMAEEIGNLETDISGWKSDLMNEGKRAEAVAIGKEITDYRNELQEYEDSEKTIKAEAERLKKVAIELNTKFDQARQARDEQRRLEQARAELEVAKGNATALAEALITVKNEGNLIAEAAVGPILELARFMTEGIIATPIANRGLEIGRWNGPQWIGIDTFSGSERAITLAALQVGLARGSDTKIVLMDEFGTLDPSARVAITDKLQEAITLGLIDQAIVLSPNEKEVLPLSSDAVIIRTSR
jgi:DNA repair exonuclease SbcCD ATPase subunit